MNAALTRRDLLIALSAMAAIGCNRRQNSAANAPRAHAPDPTAAALGSHAVAAPWEPIDEMFRGCEGGCGARVAGTSADVVVQPGAQFGQHTYCPVSGVVFTVTHASPHHDVTGRSIYLCCASCAQYFAANRDRVIALRQLAS
jgi:hypothetical protein